MSTQEDVQIVIAQIGAARDELERLDRELAGLLHDWEGLHVVYFENGEQLGGNSLHLRPEQFDQLLQRIVPRVTRWQ